MLEISLFNIGDPRRDRFSKKLSRNIFLLNSWSVRRWCYDGYYVFNKNYFQLVSVQIFVDKFHLKLIEKTEEK